MVWFTLLFTHWTSPCCSQTLPWLEKFVTSQHEFPCVLSLHYGHPMFIPSFCWKLFHTLWYSYLARHLLIKKTYPSLLDVIHHSEHGFSCWHCRRTVLFFMIFYGSLLHVKKHSWICKYFQMLNRYILIKLLISSRLSGYPDSKVHGANMGPNWVLSAPAGVGPMNLAIRVSIHNKNWRCESASAMLYPPLQRSWKRGILVSPCPSVRLWTESCPLCIFNNTHRIHFIFAHLIKQLQRVCRV